MSDTSIDRTAWNLLWDLTVDMRALGFYPGDSVTAGEFSGRQIIVTRPSVGDVVAAFSFRLDGTVVNHRGQDVRATLRPMADACRNALNPQ